MAKTSQARLDAKAAEYAASVGAQRSGMKHEFLMRAISNAHGQPFGGGEFLSPRKPMMPAHMLPRALPAQCL